MPLPPPATLKTVAHEKLLLRGMNLLTV